MDQNIIYDEFNNKLLVLHNALVDLKSGDDSKEIIDEIFRAIHTIKATADILFLLDVVTLTHKAEDILEKIREGKSRFQPELVDLFFEFKDYIELVIKNTSNGIFNDESVEKLYIYFEAQFDHFIENSDNKIKKTVLVVEDSTIVRYMIKKIINDAGYNALTSANGESGLRKIRSNDISLVIADMTTKDVEALDMIEELRVEKEYQDLPVVMLVDNEMENMREVGISIKAKAWLHKPVKQKKLLLVLEKILG